MLKCLIAVGMCLNNTQNIFLKQSNGSAEIKQACNETFRKLTGCRKCVGHDVLQQQDFKFVYFLKTISRG